MLNIQCIKNFVRLIFVVDLNHENILTMNISQITALILGSWLNPPLQSFLLECFARVQTSQLMRFHAYNYVGDSVLMDLSDEGDNYVMIEIDHDNTEGGCLQCI